MSLEGIAALLLFLIGILSECNGMLPHSDEEYMDDFYEEQVQIFGVCPFLSHACW
jgi:hypothetical protein